MTIEIEKNIPIPRKPPTYPLAEMEVGDSFAIEIDSVKETALRTAIFQHCRKNQGQRFSVRKLDVVMRCWRIA